MNDSTMRCWRKLASQTLLVWIIVGGWTQPMHAQLPADCSASDRNRSVLAAETGAEALAQGDVKQYMELVLGLESGLSESCRHALDRLHPARVECTTDERGSILHSYERIMATALQQDFERMFASFDQMEASVSRGCWVAVNQPTDPGVRASCSAKELNFVASYATPLVHALRDIYEQQDYSQLLQLGQSFEQGLTPGCNKALTVAAQAAAQKNPAPSQVSAPALPSVVDHGNGTYSVPGLGACTPSECMAF